MQIIAGAEETGGQRVWEHGGLQDPARSLMLRIPRLTIQRQRRQGTGSVLLPTSVIPIAWGCNFLTM